MSVISATVCGRPCAGSRRGLSHYLAPHLPRGLSPCAPPEPKQSVHISTRPRHASRRGLPHYPAPHLPSAQPKKSVQLSGHAPHSALCPCAAAPRTLLRGVPLCAPPRQRGLSTYPPMHSRRSPPLYLHCHDPPQCTAPPRGLSLCAPPTAKPRLPPEPCPFALPYSMASHSPPREPQRSVLLYHVPLYHSPIPPTTSQPHSPSPHPQPQPLLSLPPPPKPASVQPYGHAAHGIARRPRPPLGRVGSLPR